MSNALPQSENRQLLDISLLVMRVIAGAVFVGHGGQKLFGLFDGPGLSATVNMMGALAYPVAIGEFFGGLGLILGFLTRFSAASLMVIMIGAIATVHGANGFFLNNNGFEYNLALIGLMLPIFLMGPGRYAVGPYLPLPKSARTGRPRVVLE